MDSSWNNQPVEEYLSTHREPSEVRRTFKNELRSFLLEYNSKAQGLLVAIQTPQMDDMRREWLSNVSYMLDMAIKYGIIVNAHTIAEIRKFHEYISKADFSNRVARIEFDERTIQNTCQLMGIVFDSLKVKSIVPEN